MWDLSKEAKLVRVLNAVAAGQVTQNSTILNMSTYDGVLFALMLNTVTPTAVCTLQAQDNSVNSTVGMTNITDAGGNIAFTTITDVGGASSNGVMVLDVVLPQQQFVRAQVNIATANVAIDGILAVLYRSKSRPTLVDATVIAQNFFNCKT
jgi:hypothetical protein